MTNNTKFHIYKTSIEGEYVNVFVEWLNGSTVFTFPKSYPLPTILAHIRIEVRQRQIKGETADPYAALLGTYDGSEKKQKVPTLPRLRRLP